MISDNTYSSTLAATGVFSPVWVPMMDNLNTTLTVILTTLGIFLTVIKIVQAFKKKKD